MLKTNMIILLVTLIIYTLEASSLFKTKQLIKIHKDIQGLRTLVGDDISDILTDKKKQDAIGNIMKDLVETNVSDAMNKMFEAGSSYGPV